MKEIPVEYNPDNNNSGESIYRYIFESSPNAISVIDLQGYIFNYNRKWLDFFGYTPEEMSCLHILDMIPGDEYQSSIKMIRTLLLMTTKLEQFEGYFLHKNGSKIWVDLMAKMITGSSADISDFIVLYADVNKKASHEKTHKSSEIKSHVLLEQSPIGIAVYRAGVLLFANTAFAKMFGYEKDEEIIGVKGFNHVITDQKKIITERNIRFERGLSDENNYETTCSRKDGSEFHVHVSTVRIILGGEPATLGFIQDITKRKHIEEDLKSSYDILEERVSERTIEIVQLNQQVINSQEQERKRIAKDLHDGVGQSILAAKVNFSIYSNAPELYPDRLKRGLLLIDQSIRELREISTDLFPSALDEFGLASAIKILSKYSLGSSGIQVDLDLYRDLKIRKETEINLYRIVQESFSNILKHSGADMVKITLESWNETIRLTIEDNGRGFDPASIMQSHNHCGLISMKQRAEGLGGIMIIDTEINLGTKLMVILKQ